LEINDVQTPSSDAKKHSMALQAGKFLTAFPNRLKYFEESEQDLVDSFRLATFIHNAQEDEQEPLGIAWSKLLNRIGLEEHELIV